MDRREVLALAGGMALATALGGCASSGAAKSATSLFQQLGGMETVNKLASSFLSTAMKDPNLSGLLGKVDPAVAAPKLSNQLCATLGGGCTAPYTVQQINNASNRVTTNQKHSLGNAFKTALEGVTSDPAIRAAVTSAVSSNLAGIVGAVI